MSHRARLVADVSDLRRCFDTNSKEYIEQTYHEMLQKGFTKTEAKDAVKRIVETKTLAFIGEMNRAEERSRKENQGIRRIRNSLRDWLAKVWQSLVLEFRIHFF